MTASQMDIFAELCPQAIAKYYPGGPYRSECWWQPENDVVIQPQAGIGHAKLMAAWTGKQWVSGFLMTAYVDEKLLHIIEIMPGAVIWQRGCRLQVPNKPITGLTRPGVLADAAHTLAIAMAGFEDERLRPLMNALDEYRRREVVRL